LSSIQFTAIEVANINQLVRQSSCICQSMPLGWYIICSTKSWELLENRNRFVLFITKIV